MSERVQINIVFEVEADEEVRTSKSRFFQHMLKHKGECLVLDEEVRSLEEELSDELGIKVVGRRIEAIQYT